MRDTLIVVGLITALAGLLLMLAHELPVRTDRPRHRHSWRTAHRHRGPQLLATGITLQIAGGLIE